MYFLSIISLEIIIQIYLVVLYTKLALFCGLTEGQDFEFKQAGYDKIDIPSPKVWIRDVSFEGCRDECKARPSYTAVNYHTFVFLCELDLEPSPEVVPTTDRGLLYWIKTTLEDQIQCGTESCGRGFVCDKQKNKCEVKECGTLSIPNSTVILGNVNAVGAKLKMRCKDGFLALGPPFITLTCGTNGNWSTDRLICIKDPECKGQFEVCTEIGDYDGCNSTDDQGKCFCKHGVNETDKNKCFSGHVIICEGHTGYVMCPLGQKISVYDAYYGRTHNGTVCPHNSISNLNCRKDSSFEMIKTACNNKQL
ncbi:uncharacterized protein LOC128204710 [Mya arenaria]|uniref:uncharacterized protein LOC128204710 n=1 Tax=Mya arenaria TaxID=6604 RepID=UPI0022E855A3|nr:uncharacterized protein LOC128204710 [Mya arenaria]